MKLNKQHDVWKTAPWHVKLSVLGVPSLNALYLYAYISFFLGLLGFFGGLAAPFFLDQRLGQIIFSGSALGLAACMYLFAIIWVKDNPDSQSAQ